MNSENILLASTRKKRLYIALLVFQLLVVFYPMLLGDLIIQQRVPISVVFMGITQSFMVLILIIVNILFVKEFITNKWGYYLLSAVYMVAFIIAVVS